MTSHPAPMPPRPPLPTVPPEEQAQGGRLVADELVELAGRVDRTHARIVQLLWRLDDPGLLEGLSPRLWLQQAGRMTAREAREVLATTDMLRSLPATFAGLVDGRLSWSQTVQLARAARPLSAGRRAELDTMIGQALDTYRDAEPDLLVDKVWQQVDTWRPGRLEQAEADAARGEYLALQPDLFGGGSIDGHLGPEGFSTVAEALDAPLRPPTADQLADTDATDTDGRAAAMARAHGKALAERLVALCEQSLAGTTGNGDQVPPRPTAHIVTTADALCDRSRTPGWLLTTLAGGRMKASTALIRRLITERGADLAGIVLDDCGQVVGVGHATYGPPGWLRDAVLVRDLVDQAPGSHTPVRRADLDHILPYDDNGPTDVDNLQPIGRTAHRDKTHGDWTVTRTRDGTLTWTHTPTALTIRRPPTWRPLADP